MQSFMPKNTPLPTTPRQDVHFEEDSDLTALQDCLDMADEIRVALEETKRAATPHPSRKGRVAGTK